MVSIQPLSLEHQSLLSHMWHPLCLQEKLQCAEYSFANNYLFRKQHRYEVLLSGPHLYVKGVTFEGSPYFIPTRFPDTSYIAGLQEINKEEDWGIFSLFPVPDSWLRRLRSVARQRLSTLDSDYLFHSNKMKSLGGRALSSRRNLLHQLERNHSVKSKPLTEAEVSDARRVLEAWQEQSGQDKENTDYWPCREALTLLKQLQLFGGIAYVDGRPAGFILGELLTPTTALAHFCKTLHAIHGVTPFLYKDFAQHLPEEVEWINLEQDLGIPSLQQAKVAYDPDLVLMKWWITYDAQALQAPQPIEDGHSSQERG